MQINEDMLHLAGFALAHAAWSVSDLTSGELLCPLAITESSDERKLLRFEAETQEQAIGDAINALEKEKTKDTTWAFVRDGLVDTAYGKSDVLVVSTWSKGMLEPLYFNQLYIPSSTANAFQILGPIVLLNSPEKNSSAIISEIRKGIFDHPKVALLWANWEIKYSS